jgi:hypothetical protein
MYELPWKTIEDRRGLVGAIAENSARLAQAYQIFDTTGWGELAFPEPFMFGLTFVEKPIVSYSYEVDDEVTPLVSTRFPRAQGGVYRFLRDPKNFYIGAYCFACVETQSVLMSVTSDDPNYTLHHHFTFTGNALKDVPAYLLR